MFGFCSRMFEGVATCDMTTINVRWMYARISCRSSFSSSKARITPSVAFSSSSVPFASMRISSLSTRLPPNIPVVPLSPPFVYILMFNFQLGYTVWLSSANVKYRQLVFSMIGRSIMSMAFFPLRYVIIARLNAPCPMARIRCPGKFFFK